MKFVIKALFFPLFALTSATTYYICPMQPPTKRIMKRAKKTVGSAFGRSQKEKNSPLNYSDLDKDQDAKRLTTNTICTTVNEKAKTLEIAAHQNNQLAYISHAFNEAANNPHNCQTTAAKLTEIFGGTDTMAWNALRTKTARKISLLHNSIHTYLPDATHTTWVNTLASGKKLDNFEDAAVNWSFYNCPKYLTPLMGSLHMDDHKLTSAIIAFGANPKQPDAYGTTPLVYAKRFDVSPQVRKAIKNGIVQKNLEEEQEALTKEFK